MLRRRTWVRLNCVAIVLGTSRFAVAHPGLHHDIERVTRQLPANPDGADLLLNRGHLYRLDSQLDKAILDLDRARSAAPDDRDIARERGLTLSALRRDVEAEAELRRSIRPGESSSIAHAELGRICARNGRTESAIAEYSASLENQPDVDIYLERAQHQESIGRLNAAAAGLSSGLRALGGAVALRDALIRIETARGRFDAAIALVDEVLASVSVKTDWYLKRGDVWKQAGDQEAARADYERALAEANRVLGRRTAALHLYSRARVYLALGQKPDAVRDLQTALSKSPRFPDAKALLIKLESATKASSVSNDSSIERQDKP